MIGNSYLNRQKAIERRFAPVTSDYTYKPSNISLGSEGNYIEAPKNRSMLNRVFSPLNVGQYAIAGFVKGIQQQDLNPVQGLLQGIYAANPLGQGNEKWQHSFSDVLKNTDWQPESTAGKFVRGAVGMGLDIFLDPMTYVSLPLGTALKGSGKHTASIALQGNKIPINITDVSKGIGISVPQAENMIKATSLFKDGRFVGDLTKEATEFARKYNKLIGVNQKARGVTFSLANAPGGKKIFGEASKASKTIFTAEQVMEFGDKGLAPLYGKARNSIFGSKIGEMFSTSHEIFKISKNNPEAVYKHFKQIDLERGIAKNTAEAIAKVNAKSEMFKNLTPKENKEILTLMENPAEWNKIEKIISYSETKEGAHHLNLILDAKKLEQAKLEELGKIFDNVKDTDSIRKSLDLTEEAMDNAYKVFTEELIGIRKEHLQDIGKLGEYEDLMKSAETLREEANKVTNEFTKYLDDIKTRSGEIEVAKTLKANFQRDLTVKDGKVPTLSRLEMSNETFQEKFFKPKNVSDVRYNTIAKAFKEDGHKVYKAEWAADKLIEDFAELGLQKHSNEAGEWIVSMKGVTANMEAIDTVSAMSDEVYNAISKVDKTKVTDSISEYVFGQKGMISIDTWDKSDTGLSKVVEMIGDGKSKEEIANFIYNNKDFYTGKSTEIYRFAAREVGGYGGSSKFATWNDYYIKRIEELAKKEVRRSKGISMYEEIVERGASEDFLAKFKSKIEPPLTSKEKLLKAKLMDANAQRNLIIDSFKDIDSLEDTRKMIAEVDNGRFRKMYDEILQSDADSIAENARDRWLRYNNGKSYSLSDNERLTVESDFLKRFNLNLKEAEPVKPTAKVAKSNEIIEGYNKFLEGKVKVNGRLTPISEINIGGTKLKDTSMKSLRDSIKSSGDSVFMQNTGLGRKELNELKRYIDYSTNKNLAEGLGVNTGSSLVESSGSMSKAERRTRKLINNYVDEYNDLLSQMEISYTDLHDFGHERHEELMDKAITNINKMINADEAKHFASLPHKDISSRTSKVEEAIEKTASLREKSIKHLDDIDNYDDLSELLKRNFNETDIIMDKHLVETISTESKLRDVTIDKITEAQNKYRANYDRISALEKEIRDELKEHVELVDRTTAEITRTADLVREMDELINSNRAFDTYMKSSMGVGEEAVSEALERANRHVGEYILNPKGDYSKLVRDVSTDLKNELYQMGVKEVDIGKLGKEQFEGLMDMYMPHILTDEAKDLITSSREVADGIQNFGAEYGFGRKFNPHSISRSITKLEIDGKMVYNPTIEQINKFFEPMLKGNKMFNESVADIYLARAVKHTKLLYDNDYMNSMGELLGKKLDSTTIKAMESGFDSVINHGKLREYATDYASKSSMLDRSDIISNHLKDESVKSRIRRIASARYGTPPYKGLTMNEVIDIGFQEEIKEFSERYFTKEVSDKMYKKHLNTVLERTGTKEALNELQLPFSRVDGGQFENMGVMSKELRTRYEKNILKSFKTLTGSTADDLSVDDMVKHIDGILRDVDLSKGNRERLEGFLRKVDGFTGIKDAEVYSMQSSIINKTNQARELQIIRDNSDFLTLYDKATHFMKLNQTTVLPGFHTKNKAGNTFRSWLGAGEDILNPDYQIGSFKAIKSKGEFAGEAFTSIDGKLYTWDELFKSANELGVMDSNAFAKEIGASAGGKGLFKRFGLPGKFDPTDTKNFGWYKAGTTVGTFTENQDRLLHFAAQVKQGKSLEHAAELSQKFLFDYSDLTFFEQNVMKRILPYYTWIRKNTPLQLEMLLEQPGKFRNVSKVLGGIENAIDDEDRIDKRWVNDFARDWIQLPFKVTNPDGREEPVMLNPNMPTGSFNDIPNIFAPGETLRNYGNKVNPLLKIPYELLSNKHVYFDSDIVKKNATRAEGISTRLNHVASQFSVYPIAKGFAQKSGADLALHTMNVVSPFKALSYDYEKFKAINIANAPRTTKRPFNAAQTYDYYVRKGIAGVGNVAKQVMGGIDGGLSMVGDAIYEGRPQRPDEYVGALRPISKQTYDRLPLKEKEKYIPPTEGEVMYFNEKAVELEEKAMAETGRVKKYIWSLVETTGKSSRTQDFEFGQVSNIVDGDTVDVNLGEKGEQRVRILLIDSPEMNASYIDGEKYTDPDPFAEEATNFAKESLINKDVKLYFHKGNKDSDKYGRILAYIEVDGEDFGGMMLEEGMAQIGYNIDKPYSNMKSYRSSQQRAYEDRKGIWSIDGYAEPNDRAFYNPNINTSIDSGFKKMKMQEIDKKRSNSNVNPGILDSIKRRLSGY